MSERRVVARLPVAGSGPGGWRLRLLRSFELSIGGVPLELTLGAQRLIALLAVLRRPANRLYLAGVLWPDSTEQHANGSLRSALWKLRLAGGDAVVSSRGRLLLSPQVEVDYHDAVARMHRLVAAEADESWPPTEPAVLLHELLPDWYEDWLGADREILRQLQLHALEALSNRLCSRANYADAIEAATLAVAVEPTRESARRVLIQAHLAEGNVDAAIRQFRLYRELLLRELGVEPSRRLAGLLPPIAVDIALTAR